MLGRAMIRGSKRPQIGSFHTVHWLDTRSRNTEHNLPSTCSAVQRKKSIETKPEISKKKSGFFRGIEIFSFLFFLTLVGFDWLDRWLSHSHDRVNDAARH